ncbi:hypothetical protein OSTOST_06396, partial [Ostertagia ostertagi]
MCDQPKNSKQAITQRSRDSEDRDAEGSGYPFSLYKAMSSKVDLLRARFSSEKVLSVTNGTPIKAYLLPSTDAHQ